MIELARFFARNGRISTIFLLLLIILGYQASQSIPKSEDPPMRFAFSTIQFTLPSADAEELEARVVIPIERSLTQIQDVKQIISRSYTGSASVAIEFFWGVDFEQKHNEVITEINKLENTLPAGTRIRFIRATTANVNTMQMALVSDGPDWRLMQFHARKLRDSLVQLPGVDRVELWGIPESEVRVVPDFKKMAALNISYNALASTISENGKRSLLGAARSGSREFKLLTVGSFDGLNNIRNLVVKHGDGQSILVRDIASVNWASAERDHIARYNDQPAGFITVRANEGVSAPNLSKRIHRAVQQTQASLPDELQLIVAFDQSINILHRLDKLQLDLIIALAAVSLVLIPLGLRATAVVALSIPLSLAVGIWLMELLGLTLNQLSISGLIIAIGLLVDDAIVVVENTTRVMEGESSSIEAAARSLNNISFPLIGCTITLVLAFSPLLFIPAAAGAFFSSLPISVICTVLASLIISVTIVPFLCSRLLRHGEQRTDRRAFKIVSDAISKNYLPLLRLSLRKPPLTLLTAFVLLVVGFPLMTGTKLELYPQSDNPQMMIEIHAASGSTLEQTQDAIEFIDAKLAANPNIEWRMTNAGYSNPQIFYNRTPEYARRNIGEIFVQTNREYPEVHKEIARIAVQASADYPDADFIARVLRSGPRVTAPISVRIRGEDLAVINQIAGDVESYLATLPQVVAINNPARNREIAVSFKLRQDKLELLGLNPVEINDAIRMVMSGVQISNLYDRLANSHPIRLRASDSLSTQSMDQLKGLHIASKAEGAIPITELIAFGIESKASEISRRHLERSLSVDAFLAANVLAAEVQPLVSEEIEAMSIPFGYSISYGGQLEARTEGLGGLRSAVVAAFLGILIILLLQFKTFSRCLAIISVVPFGFVGGFIALSLFNYPASFAAILGFIALIGIEIKSSALIIDFADQLVADGLSIYDAIVQAAEIRFIPVMLTTLTAVVGLLPLAISENPLVSPIAVVIIGGLITSTLIARLVTPAIYILTRKT